MQLDPAIELSLRCAFLALLGAALLHKVLRFRAFRQTVAAYVRGSRFAGAAMPIAIVVMLAETAAIFACLAPVPGALRAMVVAGILLVYAAAMGFNLLRGNALLDCGCSWTSQRQPVTSGLVARNVGLALVATLLAAPVGARALQVLDLVTVLAPTFVAALVYAATNRLFMNAALENGRG